jgi:hypothetical protein
MPPEVMRQMARERALQMARSDWQEGKITQDFLITQARLYESYISGEPILVSDSEVPLRSIPASSEP